MAGRCSSRPGKNSSDMASGGHTSTKHNHLRDIVYRWLNDIGHTSHRELHVPEPDDLDDKGQPRKAILGVVCHTPTGSWLIDISVTDAVSQDPNHTHSNAHHDATAAKAREQA